MPQFLKGNKMNDVHVQRVGVLHDGIEGGDEYVRLTFPNKTSCKDAENWLLDQVYRDTTQEAGGYFCHYVTVMALPYNDSQFVAIIHYRYDV
jgi:hypothetical protein